MGEIRFLATTTADLTAEVKTNMSEAIGEHGLPVVDVAKHQLYES